MPRWAARAAEPFVSIPPGNMAFLGFRAYPTPILKPLWPFFASSAIVYAVVAKMQYAGVRAPEYAHDPKNPYGTYARTTGLLTAAGAIAKEAH